MKRKAILIEASDVEGQNKLPGAKKDVENWKMFLKSPLGGLWSESEIAVRKKPTKEEIKFLLELNKDGYCFVIFSGHGEDGSVVLNENEQSVSYDCLTPHGTKGTLIIDACRGEPEMVTVNESSAAYKQARVSNSAISLTAMENSLDFVTNSTKDIWMTDLAKRSVGIVTMIACSKGESAEEDSEAGGYYTSLLMAGAREWGDDKSKQLPVFSTLDAHDYAVANLPRQQNPEYKPNRNTLFPFAVKITSQVNGLLERAHLLKNGIAGTSAIGTIGPKGILFPNSNSAHNFYG